MKIGFYFECYKKSGGVYQYALNLLEALREIKGHEFLVFNISPDFPFKDYSLPNWKVVNLIHFSQEKTDGQSTKKTRFDQRIKRKFSLIVLTLIRTLRLYPLERVLTDFRTKQRARMMASHGVDLMFFHGPAELSLYLDIPSVLPIHDLQHKLNPQFPEVSSMGQQEKREYLYTHLSNNAFRILVDSEVGRTDIFNMYGIPREKIVINAPLPPPYLKESVSEVERESVKRKYHLPEKFLFYPAQFWPHKNHKHLITALGILSKKGVHIPLVLSGSKQELWGEYDRVQKTIDENGIRDHIHFLGYVPLEDMSALYSLSYALIMPTYFGWTNIPVVEAWFMKTAVLYSNIHGCREQAGNAALLFNPDNPKEIAEKIEQLYRDKHLRHTLIENGSKRIQSWTRQDLERTIKKIIDDFAKEKQHTG